MIRRLLQRLFGPSGDVYVVVDWNRMHIVGVSARQQGAERLRAEYAADVAGSTSRPTHRRDALRQHVYDRTRIENHELQDTE
ncbi:uncharacterized protein RMCC_1373 [Mycolicibacterium canariasense]|uniref:Uncharacterized protein n=1 Tax=Mycolicibacterium canariasense TaxID=228230 RepID=A0A100WA07_MYCCR|nr:hypothetical protein [Mycolicibacterium canariasense]MCV7208806.1 hypothetical protein [Mycolicibacterium canariasense]ORV07129.1 hypothetical protein AWB94_14095 [Mycolicibacterium canariasense]GAS94407.1 uncharacterized protein RMCC_1373 [Mycolicibacterium canariasense]